MVETPAETRTCISIASADTGTLTEVYEYAAAIPDPVWQRFTTALEATLQQRPGWLSISGSAPKGLATGAIAALVRLGRETGVKVAVDTHGPGLAPAVYAGPALVKVNRHEAAELLQVSTSTPLLTMAEQIYTHNGATVVLTDGRDGAVALDRDGAVHAQVPAVTGRFPVGSGDSFLGGLVAELDRGAGLTEALAMATAAGVANALVPGPGVLEASTVESLRGQVVLRQL